MLSRSGCHQVVARLTEDDMIIRDVVGVYYKCDLAVVDERLKSSFSGRMLCEYELELFVVTWIRFRK